MTLNRWQFILSVAVLGWTGAAHADDCSEKALDIRSEGNSVRFTVEIADSDEERALGLMNRPYMGQFSGMLFVYQHPAPVSFWMANTLIPLDMLFIDQTGTVLTIHENAEPLSRKPIPGGDNIQYVFEINGGLASVLGITVGAELRHPSISPELAIWPCE